MGNAVVVVNAPKRAKEVVLSNNTLVEFLDRSNITINSKTVASKGSTNRANFSTFHEAMKWVEKQSVSGLGYIELVLEDGIHEAGVPNVTNTMGYAIGNIKLSIVSASYDEDQCIISLPSGTDVGHNIPVIFVVGNGGNLKLDALTIDPKAQDTDNVNADNMTAITVYTGGIADIACDIKNCDTGVFLASVAKAKIISSNISLCQDAIRCAYASEATISSSDIFDCTTGIQFTDTTNKVMLTSVTFTTNTTDTSIPLNEIQYLGGYISDGTAALSFKA